MTRITWTAFAGGQAPYLPIASVGPSISRGLIWLVVINPIVMTVAYWIFMLAMLPAIGLAVEVGALSEKRSRKRDPTGEQR